MSETRNREVGRDAEAVRPKVAVDTVLFAMENHRLRCYLVQLRRPTASGRWAFPGGLVRVGETLDEAARRELKDATGLEDVYLEQLFSFGDPSRDPHAHVVSVGYMGLINSIDLVKDASKADAGKAIAGKSRKDAGKAKPALRFGADEGRSVEDAIASLVEAGDVSARSKKYASGAWYSVGRLPPLAYDHATMANYALERLRSRLLYTDVAANLLPKVFTIAELRDIYQAVLDRGVDRRNFDRRMRHMGLLKKLRKKRLGLGRPARLYSFRSRSDTIFKML